MSSPTPWSHSGSRPLVDLTDQIDRDTVRLVAGGAYGDVYKCKRNDSSASSSLVAVKALRCFLSEDPDEDQKKLKRYNKNLRRELGLLRRLEHENIVPLLGVTRGFGPILAGVSPWMSNGTLHIFLKNKDQTLTIEERLKLVHGVISGLEYLHSIPVFHGDLHSGNVLVDEERNPRISDFGLASTIGKLQPGLSYLERLSSRNNAGAVRWAAPEWLEDDWKPQPSGDIYSFGCIMFEVLSGDIPWKGKKDCQVVLLKAKARLPERPVRAMVADEHWKLMEGCWLSPPERRPSAREVVVVVQTFFSMDVGNVARYGRHHSGTDKLHIYFFFI